MCKKTNILDVIISLIATARLLLRITRINALQNTETPKIGKRELKTTKSLSTSNILSSNTLGTSSSTFGKFGEIKN